MKTWKWGIQFILNDNVINYFEITKNSEIFYMLNTKLIREYSISNIKCYIDSSMPLKCISKTTTTYYLSYTFIFICN
jgi:hypothetical protein